MMFDRFDHFGEGFVSAQMPDPYVQPPASE